jgi:hypothetical protein
MWSKYDRKAPPHPPVTDTGTDCIEKHFDLFEICRLSVVDVHYFRVVVCDTDHCLVAAKVRDINK